MDQEAKHNPLPAIKRLINRQTVIWTLLVVVVGTVVIRFELDHQRDQQLQAAQYRLNSLHDSLAVTFQQLGALPRALGRQNSITGFLAQMQIEWSSNLSDAERAQLSADLGKRPDVRQMSATLRETAKDFQVTQIYLLDPYGTIIADSFLDAVENNIGGNRRTRLYFTEAIETGSGTQFLIGRATKTPGFYFAARVGDAQEPSGLVVVKQSPQAMKGLIRDAFRRLYVIDPHGVVLMSTQQGDVLSRIVTPATQPADEQTMRSLYQAVPPDLGWELDTIRVNNHPVTVVTQGGQRFLAMSNPLEYGNLTAWTLIPMDSEANLIAAWAGGMGLILIAGYAVMAARDQRIQRLHSLTHAQRELENMAHALPLTVFRYQQNAQGQGRFTFIGDGLRGLLGISAEELNEDPTWAWRIANREPALPPTEACEFPIQHGGKRGWVRCESLATTHPDGSVTYNGYWVDITERKHLSEQTQAVFANSPLAFIYYDDQLSVTRCNQAALDLFGVSSEAALLGLKPQLPPMSPPMAQSVLDAKRGAFSAQLQRGEVARFEWRYTRLDGTPFDADVVAIPFVVDGKNLECAIIQDITARKLSESAIRQAQQAAESAAVAKSQFLANMSHEIRTPMNAVLGMTHLALMDELPDRARNYIDKAHRAASNLLQILNDVLDVSKIESGKLTLETTEFQLETVVSAMADVLGVKAEEKGLELLFTAPPDIPTSLVGDPTRLGQILINLGTNAIKFTQQGDVLIGCEVQRMDPQEVTLHFWVRDTGIGMSTEQLDRLFQPFTQGDSSTTRQYGGTGLGLTISRQLTELMHGQIWVDSQPGHGSTFHFTARFGLQAQPSSRRALLASELKGKRVLLVDDNPAAREVLGEMTRRLGLDVDTANGGEQALALMQQAQASGRPHQVLLTDWKMPGMDGIAFARKALAMPPEHRPCVLLVTAFGRDEALKAAEGIGLAGVINKPVTPSTLLDTFAHVLGQDIAPSTTPRGANKILEKAQRQLAGARVLLVEDQPLNQELACDLLERAGLSVVTAVHGQDAIDKLQNNGPFDGVLMDCQMPVMDGYTATERIRTEPQWQQLPIIAMTASAMASDRDRVLQSGMNDHITKPLDLSQMFTIMARWIVPSQPAAAQSPSSMPIKAPRVQTQTLDTIDGLSRCMGNLDLYRRLLKGFVKTQSSFGDQFKTASNDTEMAAHVTHTLKGLAGNIGAKSLLAAAHELEQALHNQQDHAQALQATQAQLDAVLQDIAHLIQPDAEPTDRGHNLAHDQNLRPYWTRLAQLIADNDAQAGDLLRDAMEGWPELNQSPTIGQLKKALDQYDFDEAAVALSQL